MLIIYNAWHIYAYIYYYQYVLWGAQGIQFMKLLLCCEFFHPSVGGVQEVVKQLAERLVVWGHDVTVATSTLSNRESLEYRGIKIKAFGIHGNLATGLVGDTASYQSFVRHNNFDLVFIYAAQQWTFDALWEVLPSLTARKVFVPCGYSGLADPLFNKYFERLPTLLRCFDAVIYHATHYRDTEFAQRHGLHNGVIIPNGADDREFSAPRITGVRVREGLSNEDLLLLTVGSLNGAKGHLEVAMAFANAKLNKPALLLLNGNPMPSPASMGLRSFITKAVHHIKNHGALSLFKITIDKLARRLGHDTSYVGKLSKLAEDINTGKFGPNKRAAVRNLDRDDLVGAFFESDLFIFASTIEYSPLVLYESCAAGLPFLSVPVGNACEIAEWTGGGEICPARIDKNGYTRVDPIDLARHMEHLLADDNRLASLGKAGRGAWEQQFNWGALARRYEILFAKLVSGQTTHNHK